MKPRRNHARPMLRSIELFALAIVISAVVGCPLLRSPSTPGFAATEPVTVAPGKTVEVALGAGAPSLADSTWSIHRADDDTLLFRIEFGPQGQVVRLFDSFVFGDPWLGSEIIADTDSHPTAFAGGSYLSGAYAAETDDGVGVLGVLHGRLLGAHVGTATLEFSGAIDGDRIDGTMVRTVEVFAETPFPAPSNAEFAAYALRGS